MGIETRRLTFAQQASRNTAFRDRAPALEVYGPRSFGTRAAEVLKDLTALSAVKGLVIKAYTPCGIELNVSALLGKTPKEIDAMAAKVDELSRFAIGRIPGMPSISEEDIPEMIPVTEKFSIMKDAIQVRLFKRVMEGCTITGHDADKLQSELNDPSFEDNSIMHVSLSDAREFAKRLSAQTGRNFRVVNSAEFDAARELVYEKIIKSPLWVLTETETEPGSGAYILRCDLSCERVVERAEKRFDVGSIILVEDRPIIGA